MSETPTPQSKRAQKYRDFGISIEDAASELATYIEDAVDFLSSELEGNWAKSERYYAGEVDLQKFEGRSTVVKTETRDSIRNLMPSIMRILMQSRSPVSYIPTSVQHAQWVDQQGEFITQLFYRQGGYMQLYQSVLEALKLKIGPMKVTWEPDPRPKYIEYTHISFQQFRELVDDETFEVEDFENVEEYEQLYNVRGYQVYLNGCIRFESVPNYEFFISRNVNSIEMALERGVHGQKAVISVAEALDMGLEYDDWISLDSDDPEQGDFTSSSTTRRGYNKDDSDSSSSQDLSRHQFTLYEVYANFDLKNTGRAQTYRFYLGGSGYTYLHHEEVDDSPFALIVPIPESHTVYGQSIPDLTMNEQDTSTSLLRATVDNAHAANGARFAADPTKTNFDDLMNNALNAPIRKRAGDTLQVIQVPFTGQGNLGLMQYLDLDLQNKVGVSKAAQGLAPDAMQSTDKDAVINTIQTSQGQAELIVRNIIETGLIRLFRLAMRLATRHMDRAQLLKTKGKVIPISLTNFDPDAAAVPNVGLGTGNPAQRNAILQMIYQEQKQYMEQFGPNNPFTSFAQIYNTLEDILEANSVYNVERYFNIVTPGVEKKWAQEQEKKMIEQQKLAQQNQPMDPSKAYIEVEQIKSSDKQMDIATSVAIEQEKLRLRAIEIEANDDLTRDKMIQEKVLKLIELQREELSQAIGQEQRANARTALSVSSSSDSNKASSPKKGTTKDE